MRSPQCLVCCSAMGGLTEQFPAREQMQGIGATFNYAECPDCGALCIVDLPTDLGPYYADGYYSFETSGPVMAKARALWIRTVVRKAAWPTRAISCLLGVPPWVEWFERAGIHTESRILDVGSGGGRRLDDLAVAGYQDVTGIDPHLPEGRLISDGVRLLACSLDAVRGSFDLIMFNHSLEHVPDQVGMLRLARALLAPGGKVLVRVPVLGLAWDVYGADWVQLDPPRHLVIHSEGSLRRAAAAGGLVVEGIWYDSTTYQFWGSELYESGVSLTQKPWSRREIPLRLLRRRDAARRRAAAGLNRDGLGDQAQFLLRAHES